MSDGAPLNSKDDERAKYNRRAALRDANNNPTPKESARLDSSLKRHTALIKRVKQSIATDNRDTILKDVDQLSLEKYIDEITAATIEGIARCRTDKDVWSAVEVISAIHRRFPHAYTPGLVSGLALALAGPGKPTGIPVEQREKDDAARLTRQRPVFRVCSELALVGIIADAPGKSGGEWMMGILKGLISNDPSLSSMPLLTTFLKSYASSYLGVSPKQAEFPDLHEQPMTLVEPDVRERFKKMCGMYYDNVSKKLVIEHKRLQEQDRRNHEAYIRSGEIFEDRQQAYEKMTKNYERLLANTQTLSELLFLPMPELPTAAHKSDSIQIGTNASSIFANGDNDDVTYGGKWEDEEERRFFEDVQDIKDFVPRSVLGLEDGDKEVAKLPEGKDPDAEEKVKEGIRQLEEEIEKLASGGTVESTSQAVEDEEDGAVTPVPGTPRAATPTPDSHAPQGASQLLTALLTRLPDATNREFVDQAAVDFAFLSSKAARKRLVKFLSQVPKNRTDLLPHYSRLVATLCKYMPDIGTDLIAVLDEEFRYLQRKKNVVKELAEVRLKNIMFISNLTKFGVVPVHTVLHMFKVCLDDFSGTNVENIALLLEGCGRYLLRSEETRERFGTMLELMRRKQSLQHFDQRQLVLLENAYYQCNPPERGPRQEKQRSNMELFIRHLIYDVLAKRTIDKVLKLIRKLDWEDETVVNVLFKIFTKPWKIRFVNVGLLAMLTYDLHRYHPEFSVAVVDQVFEDIRRGVEQNIYNYNQRRMATIKFLGELYIFRMISSSLVFDTLWMLVTFGHPDSRPMPNQPCAIDMPDDSFRIRLICTLLDTCGSCFDRGSQKKKLDNFLIMFQFYIHCKQPLSMDVDFMVSDTLEILRPKFELVKTVEEAAKAMDDMMNTAFQSVEAGVPEDNEGDDSSDSEDEEDEEEDDEEDDAEESDEVRAPSPDQDVILSSTSHEHLGPTEDDEADFAKELARMVTDTNKVDKKAAQAFWDSAVLPAMRGKKKEDASVEDDANGTDNMRFMVLSRKGNKQQARQLAIPSEAPLAVQTRTAQLQDKVEQQHLKRLVLDYEHREELEELKALEMAHRHGAIKIRFAAG
ncbi:ARM repeat-containing protein [Cylindrobasidium torrendii FP15055 ss-10]|uniref:ARM repeat-containing protein n=1 Tax=Cylindrobasidium torrendii FP15055 ss-10 TaxID=1314674 RepID=A0A0D7B9N7_9AGAR|nr:ARM repeat-containing protein [Cylindrobasidium torrendii FP15055 ss-10]